jgi:uncharacterized peroxidase-related enzyme
MTRIPLLDVDTTEGPVKAALEGVARKRGYVPTPLQVMAHSPATLSGYLGFATAMAGGALNVATRERIAIGVAHANDCQPCLFAHTNIGRAAGLSQAELDAARDFASADKKANAALALAREIVATSGHVADSVLQAARAAGLSDGEIVEIVGHVVVNQLTNFANSIAKVPPPATKG